MQTPYEYIRRGISNQAGNAGAQPDNFVVLGGKTIDPDYWDLLTKNSGIDYDYFTDAGVFAKSNPKQGKLAGDKGKDISDENGGSGGHNNEPAQTS